MRQTTIRRPDREAMLRLLEEQQGTMTEIILRLAWEAGLSRDEQTRLRWEGIDFAGGTLEADGRTVPLAEALSACLERRRLACAGTAAQVVWSDRRRGPMAPESVSRLARTALDGAGLAGVTLMDLRHDFIIRQLETHGWPYAVQVSGISVGDLYARFSAWLPDRREGEKPVPAPELDEFKLWKLLQEEGDSPAALVIWASWKLGLQAREVAALTWEQVDFDAGVLRLPDREVPLGATLERRLRRVLDSRPAGADPHVLLTPQSRRPYDAATLSRVVRTALIRGGMERLTLRELLAQKRQEDEDARLLDYAARRGVLSRSEVTELCAVSDAVAHERLRRLTDRGKLVRVGMKYYPAGTAVPPEEQYEAIRAHLRASGAAYRQELAEVLRIAPRQCAVILKKMVEEERLVRAGQMYALPEEYV